MKWGADRPHCCPPGRAASKASAEKHTGDWQAENEYRSGQTMNHPVRRHVFRLGRDRIHDKNAAHDQRRGDNQKQAERDHAADRFDLGGKGANNPTQLSAIEKNAILMTQP